MQQLYATRAGSKALRIGSPLPPSSVPDVSATLSADGKVLTLFAVNPTLTDVMRPLDLAAFGVAGREATAWTPTDTRNAGEPDVADSFAQPRRVVPVGSKYRPSAARFDYRFPALSLTVLQWTIP